MDAASQQPNLYGMTRDQLAEALRPLDPAAYRARQVFAALYQRDALDPATWTEFPAALRRAVKDQFAIRRPTIARRAAAADGTLKTTLDLPPGDQVEAVSIPEAERRTFCISSQVGCAFGCAFCMTARLGFQRSLSAGEIVGQFAALASETSAPRGGVNVVFMGMGEPLHNFDAVLQAIELLTDPNGFGLSGRRITVSTVGLAHRIREMAERRVSARLAVSLVAADEALRAELTPRVKRWPLAELAAALRMFGKGRRERPTLEVVLLRDVNDAPRLAQALAAYARQAHAKVNLIEFNPAPALPYQPAPEERIEMFLRVLAAARVPATVRRSRGRDAWAACGQLAFLGDRTR
jgi:23S rRNA (adenine2503-C2)-methyltransferase